MPMALPPVLPQMQPQLLPQAMNGMIDHGYNHQAQQYAPHVQGRKHGGKATTPTGLPAKKKTPKSPEPKTGRQARTPDDKPVVHKERTPKAKTPSDQVVEPLKDAVQRSCAYKSKGADHYYDGRFWRLACSNQAADGYILCSACWGTNEGKEFLAEHDPKFHEKWNKQKARELAKAQRLKDSADPTAELQTVVPPGALPILDAPVEDPKIEVVPTGLTAP